MAIVGKREVINPGKGYEKDRMHNFAQNFLNAAKSVVSESYLDMFGDPARTFKNEEAVSAMREFFVQNSYDPEFYTKTHNVEALEEHMNDMNELFTNDLEAVNEYSAMATFNPVIGLSFPIHKYILMNCMFDKCIPHGVAVQPRFAISIETRVLVTPEGDEIDMFREQNKIYSAMIDVNPLKVTEITLPENETTDILATAHNRNRATDNLSTETYISAVKVPVYLEVGDINPETGVAATTAGSVNCWLPVEATFTPSYGEYDRILSYGVKYKTKITDPKDSTKMIAAEKKDYISGYMKKNMFTISSASGGSIVSAVRITSRVDPSNAMLNTCSVSWRVRSDVFDIPNATPINVPIAPEEVKDINAMYQVNQVTKIMAGINTVLGNYKDDYIKNQLDDSFMHKLPETQKFADTFDFAPREGYYGDHIQWRRDTFMDALDTIVTNMIQVWNDPNISVAVVGRAELIRKITPTSYTYQSPASLGAVDLDFVKTVVTSDRREYLFMSSDKMRDNNNLIIILNPKNTDRIMYKIFDYQAYVSNEIRNPNLYTLPAIHAFERFKFLGYQPVQSRLRILNPTGLKTHVTNSDPIGKSAMNDFTANLPESVRNGETTNTTTTPTTPSTGGTAGGSTPSKP